MQQTHDKEVQLYERRIKKLEAELAKAYRDIINNREHWFEVFEDLEKEYNKNLSAALKKAEQMEMRALHAERQRDEALDKVKEQYNTLIDFVFLDVWLCSRFMLFPFLALNTSS